MKDPEWYLILYIKTDDETAYIRTNSEEDFKYQLKEIRSTENIITFAGKIQVLEDCTD